MTTGGTCLWLPTAWLALWLSRSSCGTLLSIGIWIKAARVGTAVLRTSMTGNVKTTDSTEREASTITRITNETDDQLKRNTRVNRDTRTRFADSSKLAAADSIMMPCMIEGLIARVASS
jgi:hypothetical protein